ICQSAVWISRNALSLRADAGGDAPVAAGRPELSRRAPPRQRSHRSSRDDGADLPAAGARCISAIHQRRARQRGVEGMNVEVGGFFGLLVLIADIWAIVNVFGSTASTGAKVGWTVLILL